MNNHYRAAIDGLNEIRAIANQGVPPTEATALAVTQTRAILAVAEEQAKTNVLLETANLIAYAQLCSTMRDGAKFAKARNAAELAMKDTDNDGEEDGF
ncbi:hypothetical protein Achl_4468 (plasmid) [Pseudarthrobacter chlorophenolicus A6]|uniref:Uncharacterized protein n=1 Tax=Pseudarthrobacter chlorophenolicus (strain ATCC 700700 / DSM 12829 / CIP 107037 / JCM 12360 / KCTC 9906 / NCIMB 13794 / A6) TaxID=452863 RepID=B8HJ22_PSECP|nr:hypothetical protein [Pseudarthrobacter chlorophenolicus]ACL42419.1 hypothetical protein Achl_4468 [Pseudarthrobacter chlorophenolicus A6]SDQ17868.1 hypothetical protein SAMN04489738_0525 [Pseudarthrobacter chlorophenolicus]